MSGSRQCCRGRKGPSIRSADEQLELVGELIFDTLVVLDDHRRYVAANAAAADLFGVPVPALLERRADEFVPEEMRENFDYIWHKLDRNGRHEGAGPLVRDDGEAVLTQYRAAWNFRPGRHLFAVRDLQASATDGDGPACAPISERQREVLQLAAAGSSNEEIAEILVLSPGTVKTHLAHIYRRLGARDRASAVALAMRHGLIH